MKSLPTVCGKKWDPEVACDFPPRATPQRRVGFRKPGSLRRLLLNVGTAILGAAILGAAIFVMTGCFDRREDIQPVPLPTPDEVHTTPCPQQCLVSKKPIDGETALTYVHQGHIYFFCSPECIELFKQAPQKYLDALVDSRKS